MMWKKYTKQRKLEKELLVRIQQSEKEFRSGKGKELRSLEDLR